MTMKENNEISPPVPDEKPDTQEKTGKQFQPKERKTLSPEEIQKRKKMLIYPLMVLIFLLAMYIIFYPSKSDKEKKQAGQGLNLDIPQVTSGELLDDKAAAYEQERQEADENERRQAMGALSDFFGGTQKASTHSEEWELVAEPVYDDNSGKNQNAIRQSATAYRDIQHTL